MTTENARTVRRAVRATATALAAGATLVLSTPAVQAQPAPTCATGPTHFALAQKGDIVLYSVTALSNAGDTLIATVLGGGSDPSLSPYASNGVLSTTTQTYGHVAMVWDDASSQLTDTNWSEPWLIAQAKTVPGYLSANGACSLPLPPTDLKYMSPGIESGFPATGGAAGAYATSVQVLPHNGPYGTFGSGPSGCSGTGAGGAPGGYKLDRFAYDDGTAAGQCADYMVYGCGVPWNGGASPCTAGQYLGCWADSQTRDLPYFAGQDASMKPSECEQDCAAAGYSYAGVQDGNQCFCGNSYGSQGPSPDCDVPCEGDAGSICGGAWVNSVYTATAFCPSGPNGSALTTPLPIYINETAAGALVTTNVYWDASNAITPSAGPCDVARAQVGDYGGMQVLNELFWGEGATDFHAWSPTDGVNRTYDLGPAGNPGADDPVYYPGAGNCVGTPGNCTDNAANAWPGAVYPGPTPDRIMAAYLSEQQGYAGYPDSLVGGVVTCTCPYGYEYSTSSMSCYAPTISEVVNYATGVTASGNLGSYIEIYGTGFEGGGNDIVWLGTTYLGGGTGPGTTPLAYDSTTLIYAFLPSTMPTGPQSLEVAMPSFGAAYSSVDVVSAAPTISVVYNDFNGGENTATYGQYVTIYGSGFGTTANSVTLDGDSLEVVYNSATQINAFVNVSLPNGAYPLQVTNETNGYSTVTSVSLVVPMSISVVYNDYTGGTNSATYGEYITIYGSGFGAANGVTLNGGSLPVTYDSTTQINAYVDYSLPSGTYTLAVYNESSGQTATTSVTVNGTAPAYITAEEWDTSGYPANVAYPGQYMTIYGTGFGSTIYWVYLGGFSQPVTYWSNTQINVLLNPATYAGDQILELYDGSSVIEDPTPIYVY